jgi:hypothetical protein
VSRKRALERWLETDDEDEKIKQIKENIKLLLYDSRKMVRDNEVTGIKVNAKSNVPKSKKIIKVD